MAGAPISFIPDLSNLLEKYIPIREKGASKRHVGDGWRAKLAASKVFQKIVERSTLPWGYLS